MGRRRTLELIVVLAAMAALALPAGAAASGIQVGVGRADITPPTGYRMMGWIRGDAKVIGQHTRLWARVIVLKQGGRKLALVAEDLNGISGGMLADAASRVSDIGYSQMNVLDSASHTHAAPTGYYNFPSFNTYFMTINSPTDFNLAGGFDPQLYGFMVDRLALAIRRADSDLAPGAVGWGHTRIKNLTMNRSLEAHLYDHGIHLPYGAGKVSDDPKGPLHTIDPNVNVLRVDKLIGGRMVPVGVWTTFANHGTVNKFQFTYYNEDHHGPATWFTEQAIRALGHVPPGQDVVDVYGNSDEGDQSSGLEVDGPAAAERIGTVESRAFLNGWRQAGRDMQRHLPLDWRWTRMCFCGQPTAAGPVDSAPAFGLPQFTGSEEGRGPLFDITRFPFEGQALPYHPEAPQGDKITVPLPIDLPTAVPMMSIRIGDHLIVSVPGEATEEVGRRLRAAVGRAAAGSGINRVVISGLANEYADYFTTPEEYDAQHYEGAATVYGRASSVALQETLVGLTTALDAGRAAAAPYPYDPVNGVAAAGGPFSKGAASATIVSQPPAATGRLTHPTFSWQGGPRGFDRPLDRAFVSVQRRVGPGWRTVDSDLGLNILWSVDDAGVYSAEWEPPLDTPTGRYRFTIDANRYSLRSHPFRLSPSDQLSVRHAAAAAGKVAVTLEYPPAKVHEQVNDPAPDSSADLTYRPTQDSHGGLGRPLRGQRAGRRRRGDPGGRRARPVRQPQRQRADARRLRQSVLGEIGTLDWTRRGNGRLTRAERARYIAAAIGEQMRSGPRLLALRAGLGRRGLGEISDDDLRVPDSKLAREAASECEEIHARTIVEHNYRSFFYARALGALRLIEHDEELLFVSTMFHDAGAIEPDPRDGGRCFTLRGADLAERRVDASGSAPERSRAAAEAITLHINPAVPVEQGAEAHLMHDGVLLDAVGLGAWELRLDSIERVRLRHPRLGFSQEGRRLLGRQANAIPGCRIAAAFTAGFGLALRLGPWQD
jgi:neutral ceramidase